MTFVVIGAFKGLKVVTDVTENTTNPCKSHLTAACWEIFHDFCRLRIFFKNTDFKTFFQENHQCQTV